MTDKRIDQRTRASPAAVQFARDLMFRWARNRLDPRAHVDVARAPSRTATVTVRVADVVRLRFDLTFLYDELLDVARLEDGIGRHLDLALREGWLDGGAISCSGVAEELAMRPDL